MSAKHLCSFERIGEINRSIRSTTDTSSGLQSNAPIDNFTLCHHEERCSLQFVCHFFEISFFAVFFIHFSIFFSINTKLKPQFIHVIRFCCRFFCYYFSEFNFVLFFVVFKRFNDVHYYYKCCIFRISIGRSIIL